MRGVSPDRVQRKIVGRLERLAIILVLRFVRGLARATWLKRTATRLSPRIDGVSWMPRPPGCLTRLRRPSTGLAGAACRTTASAALRKRRGIRLVARIALVKAPG